MLISCVTPTIRPELMGILSKCLARQTFHSFEWLVGAPKRLERQLEKAISIEYRFIPEPVAKEGDYYGLNRAWNAMFRKAKGELIISINDGLWFPPDLLSRFWSHYESHPDACVGAIGHQYSDVINGKPENRVWSDPRVRQDFGSFYEVNPTDLEFCIASIPTKAIYDVGGIDEEYDKVAALGEKEMCMRMDKLGYKFFLDQSIEYKAIKHPRLNDKWEEKYQEGTKIYWKHLGEIKSGVRLKLDYLD